MPADASTIPSHRSDTPTTPELISEFLNVTFQLLLSKFAVSSATFLKRNKMTSVFMFGLYFLHLLRSSPRETGLTGRPSATPRVCLLLCRDAETHARLSQRARDGACPVRHARCRMLNFVQPVRRHVTYV
ncbi:hypothetical protein BaRGS_00003623 [Batillaria attramentaria]|uniref:Uncharacterized protein n=1 Tax=Batillaria attramentaria TaxID=370345 RepID=A0ABD0M173_9CAEN